MTHLINWVTHLIATLGYPGVVLLMALESACIPIPSEAIMPFAGALIVTEPARGFNIHVLAFTGALGNLLGSIVAYWVGAIGGRPFLNKYGKYILISHHDMDMADRFFQKYGDITALVSRLLPIVRTFISLPAGIARMNFPRFCIYTFVGALPFCYLLTYAGVKLGEHWHQVHNWLQKADIFIGAIIIVLFGLWVWRHLRGAPKETAA
ncbi:MAG: DedA family protein [Capsulimonas sp.]|uniref:DedA family protein n=1 Tax=Capsulimonas sp. TaxID=2494211 RepID=UPI0032658E82